VRRIAYHAPTTVEQAVALLATNAPRARILAGGTDLIVQLREDLRDWDVVIDAKRIPELTALTFTDAGDLHLGAAVPFYRIYGNQRIAQAFEALTEAARIIGGIAIQGRASVGGNLCNAGPAGDSLPPLLALGAQCFIAGPRGHREVAAAEFCVAPGRTVLAPDELLVHIRIPARLRGSGSAYLRFIPREEMDIAVVGAAAHLAFSDGVVTSAAIALGAVAPTPLDAQAASAALVGTTGNSESFQLAAEIAREISRPISDMRGTAEHRRHLVGVLVRRALESAAARAHATAV
jgi:CO/xanthine dehydrogenase FAD-binding subunit